MTFGSFLPVSQQRYNRYRPKLRRNDDWTLTRSINSPSTCEVLTVSSPSNSIQRCLLLSSLKWRTAPITSPSRRTGVCPILSAHIADAVKLDISCAQSRWAANSSLSPARPLSDSVRNRSEGDVHDRHSNTAASRHSMPDASPTCHQPRSFHHCEP